MKINWERYLVFHQHLHNLIQELQGQKPILVISEEGVDRSAVINLLMGVKMIPNTMGELMPPPGQPIFARRGEKDFPMIIANGAHGLVYCDCPGFIEIKEEKNLSPDLPTASILFQKIAIQGLVVIADAALVEAKNAMAFHLYIQRVERALSLQQVTENVLFVWTYGTTARTVFLKKLSNLLRTPVKKLIENHFFISANQLDVQLLQNALGRLAVSNPIPFKTVLPPKAPVQDLGSIKAFDNLLERMRRHAVEEKASAAKLVESLRKIHTAIIDTAQQFHAILQHDPSLPDLEVITGLSIQKALIEFFDYYTLYPSQQACSQLQVLHGFLVDLHKLHDMSFDHNTTSVWHFKGLPKDELLKYVANFLASFTPFVSNHNGIANVWVLALMGHLTIKDDLSSLRQLQNASCQASDSKSSMEGPEDYHLNQLLDKPLLINAHLNWIFLHQYAPAEEKHLPQKERQLSINPFRMLQNISEMIRAERVIARPDLDPYDLLRLKAEKLIIANQGVIEYWRKRMGEDEKHFTGLINDYYTAVERVNRALNDLDREATVSGTKKIKPGEKIPNKIHLFFDIIRAAINKSESLNSEPIKSYIEAYWPYFLGCFDELQTALGHLDSSTLCLKFFAYMAGKNLEAPFLKYLLTPTEITNEILDIINDPRHEYIVKWLGVFRNLSDILSPSISIVLREPRALNARRILDLPYQPSFYHPENLLSLSRNLLHAQQAWRGIHFAQASDELPTPKLQKGYRQAILFSEVAEAPVTIPTDAICLYKRGNRFTGYWDWQDEVKSKDIKFNPETERNIIKAFVGVEKNLIITREENQNLIDSITRFCGLELPESTVVGHLISLPADVKSLVVMHRAIGNDVAWFEFSIALQAHPDINELVLRNVGMDLEKLTILAAPISHLKLIRLDLSHSACSDSQKSSLIQRLLASQPKLVHLDLAYTKFGSEAVKAIAGELMKNSTLKTINLLGIEFCDDEAGLNLLAALFVNTELTELRIDALALRAVIVDAIYFLMSHKRDNQKHIPREQEARIEYFDTVLNDFLTKRAGAVEDLQKERDIFPHTLQADASPLFSFKEYISQCLASPTKDSQPDAAPKLPVVKPGAPVMSVLPRPAGGGIPPGAVHEAGAEDPFIEDPRNHLQNGWECFDIAVGLTRQQIVTFALQAEQKNNVAIRRLLASEMGMLMHDPDPREGLPVSMRTEEFTALIDRSAAVDTEVKTCVQTCNQAIRPDAPRPGFPLWSMADYKNFFADHPNREARPKEWEIYTRTADREDKLTADINAYFERADIYENYVREYYGMRRYFNFHIAHNERPIPTMVDIVALLLNKTIVIYHRIRGKRIEIYRTQNNGTAGVANVQHNGYNHFIALIPNPHYRPPAEDKPSVEGDGVLTAKAGIFADSTKPAISTRTAQQEKPKQQLTNTLYR